MTKKTKDEGRRTKEEGGVRGEVWENFGENE
jgi:hypothetical protein